VDEGVTYELLLPAASWIEVGETGTAMTPLGPRLLLGVMGVMGVMGDWPVDAMVGCLGSGRTWSEWAGTEESMRGIRLVGVWQLTWIHWDIF
jgi:hypothetical protein